MVKIKLRVNKASNRGRNNGNTEAPSPYRSSGHLQTARDISLLFRQQWRPGILSIYLLFMVMVNWLFYFLEAKKLVNLDATSSEFQGWVGCLAKQTSAAIQFGQLSLPNPTPEQIRAVGLESQRSCANVAKPWAPNFAWASLADILPAMFGILLLIIFGSRVEFWNDLRQVFRGSKSSNTTRISQSTEELDLAKISEDSADEVCYERSQDAVDDDGRPVLVPSSTSNKTNGLGATNPTRFS
ncbi:hypothetical protein BGX27_010399 [Mortierella sp. AM989]|nr:hypothetical protein BGX27_010399 [Mortierella sp. AM989]